MAPYKHGPHYIMDKPVIFITMTYRIGPLGKMSFFSTTKDSCSYVKILEHRAGFKEKEIASYNSQVQMV